MYYSIYYIIISIFIMLGLYLVAERLDEIHDEIEDRYLPPKYRWQIVSFRLSLKDKKIYPKKKLVKFEAYWMRRAAQFFLITYLIILIVARSLMHSFEFAIKSWVAIYPMLAFAYPACSNIIVFLYTRIKYFNDKRKSNSN